MKTMAQKCLDYMKTIREDDVLDEWEDIFHRYTGLEEAPWLVDMEATTKVDPAGRSDIVIFVDGSRLIFDEPSYEWRIG